MNLTISLTECFVCLGLFAMYTYLKSIESIQEGYQRSWVSERFGIGWRFQYTTQNESKIRALTLFQKVKDE